MRGKRTVLVTLVLLVLLVGSAGLWLRAQQRQYTLNRQLIAALVQGDNKRALALVNAGADPNTHYTSALSPVPSLKQLCYQLLHRASSPVNHSPAAFMIACGAPWKDDPATIVGKEDRPGALPLVQAMLRHGANANATNETGRTPLMWAASRNRPGTAEVLLQHGANVNAKAEQEMTPLMLADQSPDTVRLLLQHGANVNAKNQDGDTPLTIAAGHDASPATVRLLIEHGAEINATNQHGATPLMAACQSPNVMRLLLQHGAEVNAKEDRHGLTALMCAAASNCLSTVRLLLEHGAEVNAKAKRGETALYLAVDLTTGTPPQSQKKDSVLKDIIRQLLAHGADPNLPTRYGNTALQCAQLHGRPDLAAWLRQVGARQ